MRKAPDNWKYTARDKKRDLLLKLPESERVKMLMKLASDCFDDYSDFHNWSRTANDYKFEIHTDSCIVILRLMREDNDKSPTTKED